MTMIIKENARNNNIIDHFYTNKIEKIENITIR